MFETNVFVLSAGVSAVVVNERTHRHKWACGFGGNGKTKRYDLKKYYRKAFPGWKCGVAEKSWLLSH